MRLFLRQRNKDQKDLGIVFGGIALLALCVARFFPFLYFLPSCPLHDCMGLPCPACGASRSITYLSQGNVFLSITANPLIAFCIIIAILFFLYSVFSLMLHIPGLNVQLRARTKNILKICVLLLVLLNWYYLIATF